MCQQSAAPTAAWAEAQGERSRELAGIPDLQLSLLPHEPPPLLCVVIFWSGCMTGRWGYCVPLVYACAWGGHLELSNSGRISKHYKRVETFVVYLEFYDERSISVDPLF